MDSAKDNQGTSTRDYNDKDYERIGRIFTPILESGYLNKRRMYGLSFMRGLFFGLGSILGGTLLIGLVVWFLTFFEEVPFLGELAHRINGTLN